MQKSKLRNAHSLPGTPLPFEGHRIRQVTLGRTAEAAKAAIAAIPEERHTLVLAAAYGHERALSKSSERGAARGGYLLRALSCECAAQQDRQHGAGQRTQTVEQKRGDDTLKNSRYLRLKNPEKQTRAQKKRFRRLKAMHLKVGTSVGDQRGV